MVEIMNGYLRLITLIFREIGTKITLNKMLTFESVKNRLDSPIFLEFNYMLLQAYDFFI